MDSNNSIGYNGRISTKDWIRSPKQFDSEILTADPCNACAGLVFCYRRALVRGKREATKRRTGPLEYIYCGVFGISFLKESGLTNHASSDCTLPLSKG